jgi:TatD DNase family protein
MRRKSGTSRSKDILKFTRHPKVVAIGEAGLDYHYDNSPREDQERGFRTHIAAARQTGLPLVIHARDADDDIAGIPRRGDGARHFSFVLHCFTGGPELARRGLALGGYVSFSGVVTFKNSEALRDISREVLLDRLLVETDAPYLRLSLCAGAPTSLPTWCIPRSGLPLCVK